MATSDRARAVEEASGALLDTEGKWRNWGTVTIARTIIKALEAAGYKIVAPAQRDGPACDAD